jgi:serine protease
LRLDPGVDLSAALHALRRRRDVAWAVPDYRAHAAGLIPDDVGNGAQPGDWQQLQWNFSGPFGVNAPQAWSNVAADGAPGGKGVVVAVLDTGVAYATHGRFLRSPDFSRYGFTGGYDFIAHNRFPNDRNGHGTFVAGTIAEATDNRYGLTGLAFAARIMPVRVLDSAGEGEASTIAEGVRYAVRHGAQVINLSLEFSSNVTAADIPELLEALRYARRRGVLVVAAAGNEAHTAVAYPARAPNVVAVGATTEHGCLADYSNDGSGLTLVAPGGGADASLPGDPNCNPEGPGGRDVFQVTFTGSSPRRFGMPGGYEGTSMAAPHVSATAALIIASGVLGRRPTPAQIVARLRATARKLGGGGDEALYGAGLVDAAAATAAGGPGAASG